MEKLKAFFQNYKTDAIIISALLVLSLSVVLIFSLTGEPGSYAEVEIDGKSIAKYSLGTDGEYILGGGTNTLIIKDGSAYMVNSKCPDRTCERTGKIKMVGERIVCLPNKISVTVRGDDGGIDIVS